MERLALRCAFLLVALSLSVSASRAQTLADFEGEWTIVEAHGLFAEPALRMTVRAVVVDSTLRGEPTEPFVKALEIERTEAGARVTETIAVGTEGGWVSGLPPARDAGPRESRLEAVASARWDGQRFVRHRRWADRTSGDQLAVERFDEWSKDAQGRLVIRIRVAQPGSEPHMATLVYRAM